MNGHIVGLVACFVSGLEDEMWLGNFCVGNDFRLWAEISGLWSHFCINSVFWIFISSSDQRSLQLNNL